MTSKEAGSLGALIDQAVSRAIVPQPTTTTALTKAFGRYTVPLALAAGSMGLYGAYTRGRAALAWPSILQELEKERSLTEDEKGRAEGIFQVVQRYAPDIARDKALTKDVVSQSLRAGPEGVFQLMNTLARTQRELRDIKPALAGPLGLAASAAVAGAKLMD